jgi:pimeloyl-ACP methyl ester carboxylesterase
MRRAPVNSSVSTKIKARRLILFSGMGGDDRLFRSIRIPEAEIVTPDHTEPAQGETLTQYASRIADRLNIQPADIVGGVSFGGMLAGEIARQRPVAGLILLGSCLRPGRLPWSYRWVERLGRFIPGFVLGLRSWRPLVRSLPSTVMQRRASLKWPLAILRRRLESSAAWSWVGRVSTMSLVLFFRSTEIGIGSSL